jgi:tetratricopeptide (TPR) repeat protein
MNDASENTLGPPEPDCGSTFRQKGSSFLIRPSRETVDAVSPSSIRIGIGLVALLISQSALVLAQPDYTQEELRALPRVCLAQTFINSALFNPVVPEAERRQWAQRLGEDDYGHFHHFCWGLIDMRRGNGTMETGLRDHNYRSAVRNFQYVERRVSRRFAMLPEVYLRMGMALLHLRDHAAAAKSFLLATTLKPDYTPAYAALIDVYVDLHDFDAAKTVLQDGLAKAPNSDLLATKKIELERIAASKQ